MAASNSVFGCLKTGALADCLIAIFAMDSAITRTLQIIRDKGEEAARIPLQED